MMQLHSHAFEHGGTIPTRYTADGENVSVPLSWTGAPPGTAEFALVMDDPDTTTSEPFVHWVLYHIPGGMEALPEDIRHCEMLGYPAGVTQGVNSFGSQCVGYGGPTPAAEKGPHRYTLHLYALCEPLGLPAGVDRRTLDEAMRGRVLQEAQLHGVYECAVPDGR